MKRALESRIGMRDFFTGFEGEHIRQTYKKREKITA
jgi:hypothetical protein